MKRPVRISADLSMPLDVMTRATGIFGQRGTGKSTTGAVIVEQVVRADGRSCVLDPTGVWYGLTRAGTGPGLPGVVLGGEHADAPLEVNAGALVAEFVIASDYPLVVLDLKLMRKYQRQHFAMEFLEALYQDNRDPLLVVADEAAQFAPQMTRGTKGEMSDVMRLLGAIEDVVKLGRSRGLGALMIEQRIATLNANVREQIETLIAHRLAGPLDRKALREWVAAQGEPEREAEAIALIAKLDRGEALVWSPAFLRYFGVLKVDNAMTYDSRFTPEVGKKRKAPGARAAVNLDVLRERMAEVIQDAADKDPKALRARLAKVEAALVNQESLNARLEHELAVERERTTEQVEVRVLTKDDLAVLDTFSNQIRHEHSMMAATWERLREILDPLAANVRDALNEQAVAPHREAAARIREKLTPNQPPVTPPAPAPQGEVSGPQQKVLDAIRWYVALGTTAPTRVQVAMIAGYSAGSGGYANILGKLRAAGLIDYPGAGTVSLTAGGALLARDPQLPHDDEGVQAEVLGRLPAPQAKLLRLLIARYPADMSREELASEAGYTAGSGGYANLLGRLRTATLIDYRRPGRVVATDVLFPVRSRLAAA